jgi:hypothetical protein
VLPQVVTALVMMFVGYCGTAFGWTAPCYSSAPWSQRPARSVPSACDRASSLSGTSVIGWRTDLFLLAGPLPSPPVAFHGGVAPHIWHCCEARGMPPGPHAEAGSAPRSRPAGPSLAQGPTGKPAPSCYYHHFCARLIGIPLACTLRRPWRLPACPGRDSPWDCYLG